MALGGRGVNDDHFPRGSVVMYKGTQLWSFNGAQNFKLFKDKCLSNIIHKNVSLKKLFFIVSISVFADLKVLQFMTKHIVC